MDEQQRDEDDLDQHAADAPPDSQPRKRGLLTVTWALLAVLICITLALFLAGPLRGRGFARRLTLGLPVTGGGASDRGPLDPSLTNPRPALTPDPGRTQITLAPGETYRSAAEDQLVACLSSFHDFFVMEEVGAHQPDLFNSASWRTDVTNAMRSFRTDCQTLASLPPAPRAYRQLERWLKLAAAEVVPATDSFSAALDKKQISGLGQAVDHLDKFVEYTNNAEDVLNGLDKEREI